MFPQRIERGKDAFRDAIIAMTRRGPIVSTQCQQRGVGIRGNSNLIVAIRANEEPRHCRYKGVADNPAIVVAIVGREDAFDVPSYGRRGYRHVFGRAAFDQQ